MDQMTKAIEALLQDTKVKSGGEPTEDHDQNAARLIGMVKTEAVSYADFYGQEVADRCVAAFTKTRSRLQAQTTAASESEMNADSSLPV